MLLGLSGDVSGKEKPKKVSYTDCITYCINTEHTERDKCKEDYTKGNDINYCSQISFIKESGCLDACNYVFGK